MAMVMLIRFAIKSLCMQACCVISSQQGCCCPEDTVYSTSGFCVPIDTKCKLCRWIVANIENEGVQKLCDKAPFGFKHICKWVVSEYSAKIIEWIGKGLPGSTICDEGHLAMCPFV